MCECVNYYIHLNQIDANTVSEDLFLIITLYIKSFSIWFELINSALLLSTEVQQWLVDWTACKGRGRGWFYPQSSESGDYPDQERGAGQESRQSTGQVNKTHL